MAESISVLNAILESRYRVERELGAGGMATVYLAEDLRHGRKVALKVLRHELVAAVGAERFLAEIRTTARLQHPHVLPLFDSGEAGSFLFYVTVRRTPTFEVLSNRGLFLIGSTSPFGVVGGRSWDVSPRDGRFLMPRRPPPTASGIRVVLDWTTELLDAMER